jgi:CBS domain-containing protein
MQRDLPRPKKDDSFQSVMMTAPIENLVTGKDLLVASTTDTIQKIVKILQDEKKDCVLIYKKKKLVGIISHRDLLSKVAGKQKDLSKVKAEAVMTPSPEYVKGEDPIAYVVNKMATGGFRHVPVLQADGTPLSIISIKDVLSYLSRRRKIHEKSE